MRIFAQDEPLTDAELDRLGDFLKSCKGGRAMNVEALDGFFAALIAGPDLVMPSEYLPEVFGGEMSEACEFSGLDEANEILELLMRHWNAIAATLHKDEVYLPILLEDENGMAHGNGWAGPRANQPRAARRHHRAHGGRALGSLPLLQAAPAGPCGHRRTRA